MRQSQLFVKTLKEDPQGEESLNAKFLIRAGYIYKVMAGVYAFLPLGLRVLKKIEEIIRKEMIATYGQEIIMSTLQPKSDWEKTGRFDSLDVLFRFTSFFSQNDYILGPTHEEQIVPILKQHIFSYRDLPVYVFQFQNKFRDEKRAKSGILRGREFLMKDFYSFHSTSEDLDSFYDLMTESYKRVFYNLGIAHKTYLTFASGGTFSKYSHEFQLIAPSGEDKIYICKKCEIAINEEIIQELNNICPKCASEELEMHKSIEVGNIFKLKDKYSIPFELKFKDSDGLEKNVLMGCYGIGVSRLVGAIVETFYDDKGIMWPESVSPFKYHLLEQKKGEAEHIYNRLIADGEEVMYDDREISLGEKFADADLIGIPTRLLISSRTNGQIEIKKRNETKTEILNYENIRKF